MRRSAPIEVLRRSAPVEVLRRSVTTSGREVARLEVQVPETAVVYIGDAKTQGTGSRRWYARTGLRPGQVVTFRVRAEITRNGRKIQAARSINVVAGTESKLALNLEESVTTLILRVPPDAKVFLGNYEKSGNGTVRSFSTTRLGSGQQVSDYPVRVSVVRNGELISKERKISLKSGDSKVLSFEFDIDTRVAAIR